MSATNLTAPSTEQVLQLLGASIQLMSAVQTAYTAYSQGRPMSPEEIADFRARADRADADWLAALKGGPNTG